MPTDTMLLDYVHFYPRPPRGGRRAEESRKTGVYQFLSTPSARRATNKLRNANSISSRFLSTPSARRATHRGVFRFRHF